MASAYSTSCPIAATGNFTEGSVGLETCDKSGIVKPRGQARRTVIPATAPPNIAIYNGFCMLKLYKSLRFPTIRGYKESEPDNPGYEIR